MNAYEKKAELCADVTNCIKDTLSKYTTTNHIDTLLGDYATKDSLGKYTTTDKIDTLLGDYATKDSLSKYTTSDRIDTLLNAYEKKIDLCADVTNCIKDTLGYYYTKTQVDSTANKVRSEIGDGTLSIKYGENAPVTFTANQKTNTSIEIPAPTAPNNATLTIQKNGADIGTFTADQASDKTINITVPTCDSLANCALIIDILNRLDKLERQNDSLARELDKLKPALTVAASHDTVTVCNGSTLPVTYTATFHNCSSSDYTLSWKVNGADSANVTGPTLTFNAEDEGDYVVVCIATRSDNSSVTDTVTTRVNVDNDVPSFTASVSGLTVTLSDIVHTATIQWDTNSEPLTISDASAEHTYSVADTVTITATSERGCTFTMGLRIRPIAPAVTTDSIPTITATTAKAYGTVTSDGGIPETKRGMVYSTSNENLKLGANGVDSVMNGTGMGSFACNLKRLVPCTQYYVRAFAINEVDTAYGEVMSFSTPPFTCGSTLTDIDGNEYATLQLGSQCWMQQNLRTTHFADGTEIPLSSSTVGTDSPRRYEPDSNLTTYGYLYNWYAAARDTSSASNPSGVQGACPDGWHLPSDAEWTQLTDFVASNSAYVCGNDPINIGKAMVSKEGWPVSSSECAIGNNTDANNSTQFSILSTGSWDCGGGVGTNGEGYSNNGHSIFVSATENEESQYNYTVYCREFYYNQSIAERTLPHKTFGRSVRCVLDCSGHTYKPTVSAVTLSSTSGTTIGMTANVDSDGGADVTERGVCWGTTSQPTISSTHATDGTGTGEFTVTGSLTPGTTYYVRAYAINSEGTAYGAEVTYVAPILPTVTTSEVSNIAATTATAVGNVTIADGGAPVTARGVCWSTYENPTVDSSHTTDGIGTGSFTSDITGLSPTTPYYVRAYATNSAGTTYGNQLSFTTTEATPTVTTNAISAITVAATDPTVVIVATCGGDVTDMGVDSVIARGVCWSTSQSPKIDNSDTTQNGSGLGSFTSNITGLTSGTTYYVRAYATNSVGTTYGDQVSITLPLVDTKSCTSTPIVTDHEGNVYATVKIGNQCWMRENLRTTTSPKTGTYLVNNEFSNSQQTVITSSFTGKMARWYKNDSLTYAPLKYGLLYNWNAALDTFNPLYGETSVNDNPNYAVKVNFPSNHRGICPSGWHLPSISEWNTFKSATPVSNQATNALASGTNTSGFTALFAGSFGRTKFDPFNNVNPDAYTYFFTSQQNANEQENGRFFELYIQQNTTNMKMEITNGEKDHGFSVRCLRDAVSVTTAAATDIGQTSATLNGSISNPDNVAISSQGFEWKATAGGSYTQVSASGTALNYNLAELTPNTSYTFRAFATTSAYGTFYGEEQSFTTEATEFTVTTAPATDIAYTSATLNGSILNPSLANVTVSSKGFEWKKTTDDDNNYEQVLVEDATLSYNLTGLAQNTSYTFRAFASLASGSTVYGSTETFTTLTHLIDLSLLTSDYVAVDQDTLIDTLADNYKISIAENATVTLRNATIDFGASDTYEWAGITCKGDATINLEGINVVKVNNVNPGIYVATGKTLTIDGQDSLFVCSNGNGAGIGGGLGLSCGNIVIEGGKIEVRGGEMAAGIGSGPAYQSSSTCGAITINGGSVTARGGQYGAGIGSGTAYGVVNSCDSIAIIGGNVIAYGGKYAAGIGSGYAVQANSSCGNIDISGTTANVTVYGGELGPGIGAGLGMQATSQCQDITISGGTVNAKGAENSNGAGAGIGTGGNLSSGNSVCGDITINNTVTSVHAEKGGTNAFHSIGRGKNDSRTKNSCGTVTIGGTRYLYWNDTESKYYYDNNGDTILTQSTYDYPQP